VLVEGAARAQVKNYTDRDEYYEADAVVIADSTGDQVEAEALARSQPAFGQVRIANELRKRGLTFSPETMTKRLKALEARSA